MSPVRLRAWRGLAVWGAVVLVVAASVVWRAGGLRTALEREVEQNYAVTTRALVLTLTAWGQARAGHAEALAAMLVDDPAFSPVADARRRAALDERIARVLATLAERETFAAGWVLDRGGRVLAGRLVNDVLLDPTPPSASWSGPARHDAGVDVRAVRCGQGACVAFQAPVRGGARGADLLGAVVLLAAVDDSTFRPLNPMRPQVRSGRTTLFAPFAPTADANVDTLLVVASVGASGSPEPALQRPMHDAPAHVRSALAAPPQQVVTGRGAGLHGQPTHFAVARVPVLDWVVLREFDRAELTAIVRGALLVQVPILATLLVALVTLARHWLRAGRTRREQELVRLRSDFVASTSHELRTPLAQIRLFAELLQKGTLRDPAESARALRIIEKEASRLTILVDNLLNYSRLRRRAEDPERTAGAGPAHVAEEVAHVLDAFAPLAGERRARVVASIPDGLHAAVDSLAFRQVLTNLLENAVKYGPAGQTITVGAEGDARCVRVRVDDEGTGVPADEREIVWSAFRRGRNAEISGHGGSGIGLAVVRELVLQYGGGVRVDDAPGGGARFIIEFPRADALSA